MKFAFFGSPEFARSILDELLKAGLVPTLLVCNPDRPVGRKKIITPPPTKKKILSCGSEIKRKIQIFQPEKLTEVLSDIKKSQFDFFIVAAYGKIIPSSILSLPRLGTIGVHPSLLPKYRGPSPIQTALLDGAQETGVSLYLMDEKVDHGPIFATSSYPIPEDIYYPELEKKLAELGGKMLTKAIPQLLEGKLSLKEQNHQEATFTKKFSTPDAFVDENDLLVAFTNDYEKAAQTNRMIHALNPEPGVWTTHNKTRIKLIESELMNGKLILKKIQAEGKKATTDTSHLFPAS